MSKETGGQAFPKAYNPSEQNAPIPWKQDGMTLRDYFAAKAMQAFWTTTDQSVNLEKITKHTAADWAYQMADAMLEARK